jgi:hypothetical protein
VIGLAAATLAAGSAAAQAQQPWSRTAPVQTPSSPKPPASPPPAATFKPYHGSSTYEHPAGQQPYQYGPQPKPYGSHPFGPDGKPKRGW